jgi:hypothetical protein
LSVALFSSSLDAKVTASIPISAGATSAVFSISTLVVKAKAVATITAKVGASSLAEKLTINPISIL